MTDTCILITTGGFKVVYTISGLLPRIKSKSKVRGRGRMDDGHLVIDNTRQLLVSKWFSLTWIING